MRTLVSILCFGVLFCTVAKAQVKIGDSPQNIDAASVLELESNSKVLVITRVSTSQMNAINPLRGALVYNTDEGCVFYHNGNTWLNLCAEQNTTNVGFDLQDSTLILNDSDGNSVSITLDGVIEKNFTTDPIINFRETIVITQNGNTVNFEVGEITGENIVNSSINGIDLQNNSITSAQLAPNSVGQDELQDNTVADLEIDYSQVTLNDFLNDAGFITNVELISQDPNNSITDVSGAFYDDSQLVNDIALNNQLITDHIAADTDDQTAVEVPFTPYVTISSTDTQNAIQQLKDELDAAVIAGGGEIPDNELNTNFEVFGGNLELTDAGGTLQVPLADITTDNQQLNLTNDVLTLEDGGAPIDLSIYNNSGTDNQQLNLTNDVLTLEDGGAPIDLSVYDNQGTDNQLLSLNNDVLTLEDGGAPIDLSIYDNSGTDNQNLSITNNTINIDNGTGVDLTPILNAADSDNQDLSRSGNFINITNGAGVDLTPILGGNGEVNDGLNVGIGGVGVFSTKNGLNLEFKNINVGSTKIIVTDDVVNNEIDIDINDALLQITESQITDLNHTIIDATNSTVGVAGSGTTADPYILTATAGDGSETIIDATNSTVGVAGTGTTADPYILTATTGDGSETIIDATNSTVGVAGSGTTTDPYILSATASDGSETIIDATNSTVGVAGTGTTADPYILTATAGDGSETIIDATNSTVGVAGTGTTIDPYILTATAGDGSETIIDATNSTVGVTGAGTTADPYVLTATAGDGSETIIDAINSTVGVTGTGTTADPYILTATVGDGSETIIDATNSTVGVTGTGTTTDPYILTATAGDGSETIIDATNSTVGVTGTGTTADPYILTGTVGDGSETIIDATNSTVGVTGTGTTADPYILTATAGDGSETIIDATNSTVGVAGTGTTANPYILTATAADGSETIIDGSTSVAVAGIGTIGNPYLLTVPAGAISGGAGGQIIDGTIIPADIEPGVDGQVLLTAGGGTMVQWGNVDWNFVTSIPAGFADDVDDVIDADSDPANELQEALEVPFSATGNTTSDNVQTAIQELQIEIDGLSSGGTNLSNSNLIQTEPNRTYEIEENESLVFTGLGSIGFGNGANPPLSKFHFAGEVRVEGVNSAEGSAGSPSYSFSTANDSNTGMYRPAADQIGFSVGGFEAMRLDEVTTGQTEVIINQTLDLDGDLLDVNDNAGTAGQILSSTGTGVQWITPTGGAASVSWADITGKPAGFADDTDNVDDADNNPTNELVSGLVWQESTQELQLYQAASFIGVNITGLGPDFGAQDITTSGNLNVGGTVTVGGTQVHPDYVFEKYFKGVSILKNDYEFMPLKQLERFLRQNHHLPGIKSAAQVKKEGAWDLGASNIQNLEKIEELFLHTIEQEKKIETLKSQNDSLSRELNSLKKDMYIIKSMLLAVKKDN